MKISEKILSIRESHGLTQKEFAARVFVTRQAVSKWEKGKSLPSLEAIECICKEFNVPLEELKMRHGRPKTEEWIPLGERSYKPIGAIFLWLFVGLSSFLIINLVLSSVFKNMAVFGNTALIAVAAFSVVFLLLAGLFLFIYYPYKKIVLFYNCKGIRIIGKADHILKYEEIGFASVATFTRQAYSLRIQAKAGKVYNLYSLRDANQTMFTLNSVIKEKE